MVIIPQSITISIQMASVCHSAKFSHKTCDRNIEDPCLLPYKKVDGDSRYGFLCVVARLCRATTTESHTKSHHLPSYRAKDWDSMSHTTKITILDKYYNQNQPPLKTSDKTTEVPHMAARGAV